LRAHPAAHSIVDVGVGSGAIACSIACEVAAARVDGTDISSDAVAVATINAQRLDVQSRCNFAVGDLASPVSGRHFNVVVANLPYIPSADVPSRPDPVGFEPREAVDGGSDGLTYYRRFLQGAPRLLGPGSLLLLEAAPPVMDALHVLVNDAFPLADVSVRNDYGGRARYVRVRT
jgi:release factor glutamine methyltransferase